MICALGGDGDKIMAAIADGRSGLGPISRFKVSNIQPLPVGEVADLTDDGDIPPTHMMARIAADQAMAVCRRTPDAVVMGVTTGGMATTETLLRRNCANPHAYRYHALGTVAEDLARRFHCKGPVITVSTACSSGGGALALALAMIRSGRYRRILTGGADALCRITYYGFKSLQLIDPQGCRPLDINRRGMSVAEGAGILLLEATTEQTPVGIEILGAGLSCDAHHPAQPHPEGRGALAAMQMALSNAGLGADDIDYINLHGTGTMDNDRSEALAINTLFNNAPPALSSIKGAIGHSLAASGAIEAVVAARAIDAGLIPPNTGCNTPDPLLGLTPLNHPARHPVGTVLSNSFGFGGNNAALVIGHPRSQNQSLSTSRLAQHPFTIVGWSAVTGAGFTDTTIENLSGGICCAGKYATKLLCSGLPAGVIRRIKRLSQMSLALFTHAQNRDSGTLPKSVFFGTGWGALSETHDFLKGLFESDEKFCSPTDFIGSVHNAAAGQIALMAKATGTNLTLSGGDYSFEQALFCAQTMVPNGDSVLVMGADETHDKLSPLFDPSVAAARVLADGGGALILKRTRDPIGPRVALKYFTTTLEAPADLRELAAQLGGADQVNRTYGLILAGMPAARKKECQKQLNQLLALTDYRGKVIDYRSLTGEFATSSAVATVLAAALIQKERIANPDAKAALVLGLGTTLTAIEVTPA